MPRHEHLIPFQLFVKPALFLEQKPWNQQINSVLFFATHFAVIVLHLRVWLYSQVHHDNFQLTDMDNLKYFTGIGEFENLERTVMEM